MPRALLQDDAAVPEQLPGAEPASEAASLHPLEGEVFAMPATQGEWRFWSLDQLDPGNPALNMPLMWQFTGPLDVALLEEAFAQCMRRHETLRTTFAMVDGRLSQIVHAEMKIPIPVADLSKLTGEAQRGKADELTRAHAAFRMDLKTGPLLMLKLLKFSEQSHLLLVTMHHIICDGISNGILMRDMVAFYESLVKNTEPMLPELPIQFADYAIWHEEWRESDEPEASMEFWRKTLGNDFKKLNLPHDSDAMDAMSAEQADVTGDIETLLIPRDLTARAHAFCKRENVTLNMLLFSIFCALVSRLSGQRDITIGSPCANRNEETENLIGLLMNIQVLRVRLNQDSRFRDLLYQVKEWTLGAYENQSLPFEDLVHDAFFSQTGDAFEIPVFFLYQKSFMLTTQIESAAGSLKIIPLRSESPGAVFDVMFAIVDREEEGPRLQLEYNPRHFKVSTIQRYLRLFVNLLESALDHPEMAVDELDMLSTFERRRLLETNHTAADFGPFESVPACFLRRAKANANRLAAECDGRSWTNRQLAEFATNLAGKLLAEGLEPGGRVGVCVTRSLEMVGAVLAVMIAGGAYVPLDPRFPRERLETVLVDSGASLIVTERALNLGSAAKEIEVNGGTVPSRGDAALPDCVSSDSLAYVIYTSGSTGTPKGVAIEHGALVNLLRSMEREPGLDQNDTLLALTTISFDIAALELLLPLVTGARLVIATNEEVHDPQLLLRLLERTRATVMQATPGAWLALIEQGWTGALPLKVLCGGEALSRSLADKLLDRSSDVWNMYGPTETTVWSSANRVGRGSGALRIGPPIANTQFYVLDERRQPVPSGLNGELYIGGAGLARGYWNKPQLTAARFATNPFGEGRLYQTGDSARWQDDGTIQIQGRVDFQLKVRGFRIEPSEIEGVLTSHKQVREAVVTQHVDQIAESTDVHHLVAYVVTDTATDPAKSPALIAELEGLLSRRLPDYMVPDVIHALKEMPRTQNGKIDRKALPDVFTQAGDSGIRHTATEELNFVEPQDAVERQLAEIWQTTLGIPRISIRASFFSLGVGSLAALRLIRRMNKVYGTDLGLASLLSASTIEAVAELIRNRFSPNTTSSLVPIQPVGRKPPLFIVHGVGGNVVNFYGLSMRMGAQQPVYGIQSQALVANQPALLHLRDMAEHYVEEIRKVQPNGPYYLLGYSFGGMVALEMAHQLRAAGEEVAMIGMLDSKSKDYEREFKRSIPVPSKINRRLTRFHGNTKSMSWKIRIHYVLDKLGTRTIRLFARAAASLKLSQVPAFMKSAYDINYIAIENYTPRQYDGRLILFRAEEQDNAAGARDLGWGPIFKQGVEIHDLPGDHDRIFLEPNIDELASSLRESLTAAMARA